MDGAEQTSVPFELQGNRPVITLRVNGDPTPLRFVLDTGSGISVLSEDTARKLKIKPVARGGYGRGLGGDGKFELVYAHLKKMQIGDVQMKSVPVYVRKFHDPRIDVDGYIGLALISKFLTTIDYGNRTFSITRRASDRANFLSSNEISIPLRLTSSGFLSGEVQLQGIEAPLSFIVDTGASVSVISDVVSKTEGISRYINNNETLRVIGSAGITDDMPTYLLPKISFGDHSIESVKAVALNLDTINEASGFEQAGILGGNFLKNYRLTFDFKNSKVTFVSVNPPKE
jgi:predicted aspartyl protease